MISESLATVTTNIAKLNYHLTELRREADGQQRLINEATIKLDGYQKSMLEIEIKIDQQQLELRKVLNGEESTIQVELPTTPDDFVGRES